jgi:16S rRNA processing protein RimM
VIGEIVGAHGIRGEARLRPYNSQSSALRDVAELFLVEGSTVYPKDVEQARPHGRVWIVRLSGVGTPEEVRTLVGQRVAVRETDLPQLESGQFYCYQLIGLQVVKDGGEVIGRVADVLSTAANDVLVVDARGKEVLIPMIDAIVADVDATRGRIVVRPMEGLFE